MVQAELDALEAQKNQLSTKQQENQTHVLAQQVFCYHTTANTFEKLEDLPASLPMFLPIVFSLGGKGYVGLGKDKAEHAQKTMHCYNPATKTWKTVAPFPMLAQGKPVCFVQ